MAKMLTPQEAAARQQAKIDAAAAKRETARKEREAKAENARLFAAHCKDAAKAQRDGDSSGATRSLVDALALLGVKLESKVGRA